MIAEALYSQVDEEGFDTGQMPLYLHQRASTEKVNKGSQS
jgi:hypothetical protein